MADKVRADDEADRTAPVVDEERETSLLPFPVVAIAGSAGGLEAYVELFQRLAADTGMAFVVAPHLSPEHESQLTEILSRHTQMPTRLIEDGTPPAPNQVFVLPAGALLLMDGGRFRLLPRSGARRTAMPIDSFLRSLAADQKNRAVGVLLSGANSDGALGLKAIKGEGGIAIVQDPESARFPEMPLSGILADHVDLILPPAQIAAELSRVARQFFRPSLQALEGGAVALADEPHLDRILRRLHSFSGVDFHGYKQPTLRRRIARRMVVRHADSLTDYAHLVEESQEELRNLYEDALINVTRFFRDPAVFEALKDSILPALLTNRPPDQQIRIWIAGCSTGEEVYSIAICLLEHLAAEYDKATIQIFGTDASDRSIEKARAAFYPESICTDVSPERLRRFFTKTEIGYRVSKRVRDLCIFARQNLCSDPPFSRVDLASCRNVLIYLKGEAQRGVLRTLHYALRPNGCLMLGASESPREMLPLFRPLDAKHRFYVKQGDTPMAAKFTAPRMGVTLRPLTSSGVPLRPSAARRDPQLTADQVVIARYGPPGAVVDEQMSVLQLRGNATPFLNLIPAAGADLLRMAHPEILMTLRDTVREAIRSGMPASERVRVQQGRERFDAILDVLPMPFEGERATEYLVAFAPPRNDPPATETGEGPERENAKLRRDLAATRLYLQSLVEDRDTRHVELIAAYETIQSANEELQSTNEEVETAKEELQSANEELQTLNDELRNRNVALVEASNDLSNLLSSVNIPVVMLDSELTIRQFTPPAERLMRLRTADVGRPIREVGLNLKLHDIEPLLREVLETLETKEVDVQDRAGNWRLLRVRPYRTADDEITGAVMVLLDVDEDRRSKIGLEQARDFAKAVLEAVHVPVMVLDGELRVRSANAAFRAMSRIGAPELEQPSMPEVFEAVLDWPELRPALGVLLGRPAGTVLQLAHETPQSPKRSFELVARVLRSDDEPSILVVLQEDTALRESERAGAEDRAQLAGQARSAAEALGRTEEEARARAGRLFVLQEEERRRLAGELGEGVGEQLAALEAAIDEAREQTPAGGAEARERLKRLGERAAGILLEVRRLSQRLHPQEVERLGLSAAVEALVTEFGEREGMVATFHGGEKGPDALPVERALALYRVAQEALRNVANHAGRTHVKVRLERAGQEVRLTVRDFGEGFDVESVRRSGLTSMEEWARLAGGAFSVKSARGEGTTVRATATA